MPPTDIDEHALSEYIRHFEITLVEHAIKGYLVMRLSYRVIDRMYVIRVHGAIAMEVSELRHAIDSFKTFMEQSETTAGKD